MNDIHLSESHNCPECNKLVCKKIENGATTHFGCVCGSDDTEPLFLDIYQELDNHIDCDKGE